jgi:penicillin-binding protein 1C
MSDRLRGSRAAVAAAAAAAAGAVRGAWRRTAARARPWHAGFAAPALLFCCLCVFLGIGAARARLFSPPPTPIIEDAKGGYLTEGAGAYSDFGYWEVNGPLNRRIVLCLSAAEDRRYFSHWGVDFISLARSLFNNLRGEDRQGGSTLAMQVARLEYPAPRTVLNKALEMSTALFLVQKYGRERVLRHYLTIVPQGNQIHGVAYAARRFFRKPLQDVSLAEAAVLCSLPREPGHMNVFTHKGFELARERARLILRLLAGRGEIDREELESALRQLGAMPMPVRELRPSNSYHYVLRLLQEEAAKGRQSYAGPLRATLDPDIQDLLQQTAQSALAENSRLDAHNVSIIVAERSTGEVRGYVGSSDFYDTASSGSIDYARTPRSSGSALKPLLFAFGLDRGVFTPASVLPDLPFAVLSPRGEYRAANFDDAYLGPMLYRRALANSRNIPALRVLEGVGMPQFFELARRLGLARDDTHDSFYYGYGLAIGGLYVTLCDLVAAYGALANDGRELALRFFSEPGTPAPGRQVFSSYASREVSLFLSDDTARLPSFPRMSVLEFPFPVAIKTGTSQGFRDAWTVAYSSKYIVGLWMGNADNHPMNHVAGVVSAVYAARIMKRLHPLQEEGIDATPFAPPEGTVSARICAMSGAEAGPDCPATTVEHFRPQDVPRELCTVHRRIAVDVRTGRPAGARTPPSRVALRPSVVLPAIYSLWGARRGLGDPSPDEGGVEHSILEITCPATGARYLLDPGIPGRFQTISLEASVRPRREGIDWYVDGALLTHAGFPYAARLPLTRGRHRIQAAAAATDTRSPAVTITVE